MAGSIQIERGTDARRTGADHGDRFARGRHAFAVEVFFEGRIGGKPFEPADRYGRVKRPPGGRFSRMERGRFFRGRPGWRCHGERFPRLPRRSPRQSHGAWPGCPFPPDNPFDTAPCNRPGDRSGGVPAPTFAPSALRPYRTRRASRPPPWSHRKERVPPDGSRTTQTRQEVDGGSPSQWQRVGISIPADRATSRIVAPSEKGISRSSIQREGIGRGWGGVVGGDKRTVP